MSIGERIKASRVLMGWSQRDLAAKADVSAMAISKYERDVDVPGSAVLLRVSSALGVQIEYFFRPTNVRLSAPVYRTRASLPESAAMTVLQLVQEWLERSLELESLFEPSSDVDLPPKHPLATLEEAEDVALDLRQRWNLGDDAIDGMIELLESRGVKVGLVDAHEDFDALTLWANDTVPVIVVKRDIPGDRQRFSLAHELGHLLIEPEAVLDSEAVMNRFAGAFLVPRPAVVRELGEQRHSLDLYELHLLKHRYGLSMRGWIHRAKQVGVITQNEAKQLFAFFEAQGWQCEEPGDPLSSEAPQRHARLVMRALAEDMISQGRAGELLGKPFGQFKAEAAERHGGLPLDVRR